MKTLEQVGEFLSTESGLAVVSTVRADNSVLSSVVNCGLVDHPETKAPAVAFVSGGSAARLAHIGRGSWATIAVRRGWQWVSVSGPVDVLGPETLDDGFTSEDLRLLLRRVFAAAGGEHDDYEEYDRAMAAEGRVALLVAPNRILGNT
ncbi:MAG: hypothetical protein P8M16_08205 [Acidimicrobiales bacterium]|nr:hypothetical protein [Acidimicrobiales bacterium]